MSIRFDHLLVAAYDKHRSARFFADVFGLPQPQEAGFFVTVTLSDGVVINFVEAPPDAEIMGQHFALLVDDDAFDALMGRIRKLELPHWADPQQRFPNAFNTNHGGRGVYFNDPAGHYLEALTRRYESSS